jgi:hypothetical protein
VQTISRSTTGIPAINKVHSTLDQDFRIRGGRLLAGHLGSTSDHRAKNLRRDGDRRIQERAHDGCSMREALAPQPSKPSPPLPATEVRSTRRVVRGRRRRVRMAGVAEGAGGPGAGGGHMQSASETPSGHLWALWRSAVWSAAVTAGRPRHKQVVAERRAKGRLGVPFRMPSTATLRLRLPHVTA